MRFSTHSVFIFLVAVAIAGCQAKQQKAVPPRYKNIIVLADAGKRLDLFRQAERDRSIIEKIYAQFEQAARRNFFVNSKDRLQILALPNTQTDQLLSPLQEQLAIDMQTIPVKERSKYIRNGQSAFLHRVDSFYSLAASVPEKQYSNTWKFFNEHLEQYLKTDPAFDNYIIVLSDGYSAGTQTTGYTASEALLNDARKSKNWEAFLAINRLKPVALPKANLYLFFAEMNGATAFEYFPDELKLLQQVWLGWAVNCNSSGINKTLPRITEGVVNNEIASFLQLIPGKAVPGNTAGSNEISQQQNNEPAVQLPAENDPPANTVPETKKQTVVKPAAPVPTENDKKTPAKKGNKGGYTIRQDF